MNDLLTLIEASVTAQVVLVTVLGLLIGSFLNVVILRYPIMLYRNWKSECESMAEELPDHPALKDLTQPYDLVTPASHCPKCQAPVKAWQNIPVFSYLLLRGKCSHCKTHISIRYPVVELVTGLLSLVLVLQLGWGWPLAAMLVFTWMLVSMSAIDIDHQILPDTMTLSLLWLGLLVNTQGMFTSLESAVLGAAAGYGVLWGFFHVFKLITGKEGMGFGDFKLLAALGAWLGLTAIPLIILLSSVVGAVVGIAGILILGRDRQLPIPFGPYLAAAGWIAALWGDDIITWYLSTL
ncbi:MAG: prepilin peptidase [Oceanospirillaceae bacterium]|nr:prepilin peptidase [Oceanospirillaceae bacterium]|tara:strand:- start:1085 stop:1966 length:882 start_codon:yes stop_codon:yes gene_type:complete